MVVGKDWIDGVFVDLEGIGYVCGVFVVLVCVVDVFYCCDCFWFVVYIDSFVCG